MRYTEKDIPKMPITAFLDVLGEKPVKTFEDMKLYYAPHRDDPEPMFVVNETANRWYDHVTDESGNLKDLAKLTASKFYSNDIPGYIVKVMNDNEIAKEMLSKRAIEPQVIHFDIAKIPLTDFMKALGHEHPVAADGNLLIYKAPYDTEKKPTLVINTETNLWRDTKSGAHGGIYVLAYELTGCANVTELNRYIIGEMSAYKRREQQKPEVKPEPPKAETNQLKRKMRH
ncbi:hypothetical protein [uncultured Duncaniella sp.]|jgi:hypothetical protein|uniref:hypothetical protein n=1 Tax=Duncaniella dubosii TaxID=2518971 RepID=UPI0026755B85|nr:hypothetical protein [uncultured Duncaniella sp.]